MISPSAIHSINVDNQPVQLRVFISSDMKSERKPVILMTSGLLWLGGGFLGLLGNLYNDRFGYIFANNNFSCVQVHTPNRHLAHTRIVDFVALLLLPLTFIIPFIEPFLILLDITMLSYSYLDMCTVFLIPFFNLPMIHLILRTLQWGQNIIPAPECRKHQREVAGAIEWIQNHQELLKSNGELILCGYSSGAQVAALYALDHEPSLFKSVLLISGVYRIRTDLWGQVQFLGNGLFFDVLGLENERDRHEQSPESMVLSERKGQNWFLLSAKHELLGLQPMQDILFHVDTFQQQLSARGACVVRKKCGSNHWTILLDIEKVAISLLCD